MKIRGNMQWSDFYVRGTEIVTTKHFESETLITLDFTFERLKIGTYKWKSFRKYDENGRRCHLSKRKPFTGHGDIE